MFSRILSFLGTLKSRNADITSDALRIASLEAALEKAKKERDWWEQRCRAKSLNLAESQGVKSR